MRWRVIFWGLGVGLGESILALLLPAGWATPSLLALLVAFGRTRWSLKSLTAALGVAVLARELLSGGPLGLWLLTGAAALGAMLLVERLVAMGGGWLFGLRLASAALAASAVQALMASALVGGSEALTLVAALKALATVLLGLLIYLCTRLFTKRRRHA